MRLLFSERNCRGLLVPAGSTLNTDTPRDALLMPTLSAEAPPLSVPLLSPADNIIMPSSERISRFLFGPLRDPRDRPRQVRAHQSGVHKLSKCRIFSTKNQTSIIPEVTMYFYDFTRFAVFLGYGAQFSPRGPKSREKLRGRCHHFG